MVATVAVRSFAASSEIFGRRRRLGARINDENAEPRDGASAGLRGGPRRLAEAGCGRRKASARHARGLRDITNDLEQGRRDSLEEAQLLPVLAASTREARLVEGTEAQTTKAAPEARRQARPTSVAKRCMVARPRRSAQLPARLVARILDLAGFATEPPEAEYAGRLLIRERRREARFLAALGWRSPAQARDAVRASFVDWLQTVHRQCGFQPRTLFLAVNLLDRFLECRDLSLERIHLAAATAMQLASKVDEVRALCSARVLWLCHDAYSAEDLRNCEQAMLAALGFEVEAPTVVEFLPVYLSACQAEANLGSPELLCHISDGDAAHCALRFGGLASAWDRQRNATAWRFCFTSLLDAELCRQHPPSHLAAAGVLASHRLLGTCRPWPRFLEAVSGYSEAALAPCADALLRLHEPATAPEYYRRFVRFAI